MKENKYMDVNEFVEEGYLQELNRQFLHPHGLALEAVYDKDGKCLGLGRIWDFRDEPEGISFTNKVTLHDKAKNIANILKKRIPIRKKILGYIQQPPEGEKK